MATPSVGRHYLEHGTYGNDEYDEDNEGDWQLEYDEDNEDDLQLEYEEDGGYGKSKAKFIIFHLNDPDTGKLARNGCASIRLDPDGRVAEISGLLEGQSLNDSLVDMVEAKARTLPGGEVFLPKFHDKKELIRLDKKMENNEDLTKEELAFIYELKRRIAILDTYNKYDPRIKELRKTYDVEYALSHGIDAEDLVLGLESVSIAENLDTLLSHGAKIDIDDLVWELGESGIDANLDALLSHGASINDLVSNMCSINIIKHLDALLNYGANVDDLVSNMYGGDIIRHLDVLLSHGAKIDIDDLVPKMYEEDAAEHEGDKAELEGYIAKRLDILLSHGANVDNLVSNMYSGDIAENLDTLLSHGANVDSLASKMDWRTINQNLDILRHHGYRG